MEPTTAAAVPGTDARHPDGQYSSGAKWFHWLTVPPLVIAILSGLTIRFMNDDVKMSFYTLHESLGLIILALSITRLTWRRMHPPPPWPAYVKGMIRRGADATHYALYVVLIVQPIVGFFTTNAYGFPQQGATAFLGFVDLPKFMEASPDLALGLHWVHSVTGWTLLPLLAAHIGATVYHHAVRDDGTLMRML